MFSVFDIAATTLTLVVMQSDAALACIKSDTGCFGQEGMYRGNEGRGAVAFSSGKSFAVVSLPGIFGRTAPSSSFTRSPAERRLDLLCAVCYVSHPRLQSYKGMVVGTPPLPPAFSVYFRYSCTCCLEITSCYSVPKSFADSL